MTWRQFQNKRTIPENFVLPQNFHLSQNVHSLIYLCLFSAASPAMSPPRSLRIQWQLCCEPNTAICLFCTILIKLYNCTFAYLQKMLYGTGSSNILDLFISRPNFFPNKRKPTIKMLFIKSFTDLHLV